MVSLEEFRIIYVPIIVGQATTETFRSVAIDAILLAKNVRDLGQTNASNALILTDLF
jgi:hypothetical protein